MKQMYMECRTRHTKLVPDSMKWSKIWELPSCPSPHYTLLTYLLNYLLTYSMVQSPYWEANWFAASQEIPHTSRNPKDHYRTHKRPPTVSTLGQPNLVHIPPPHLLEIHSNIIHPSMPRSPQWTPSLRFPQQEPIYIYIYVYLLIYLLHGAESLLRS